MRNKSSNNDENNNSINNENGSIIKNRKVNKNLDWDKKFNEDIISNQPSQEDFVKFKKSIDEREQYQQFKNKQEFQWIEIILFIAIFIFVRIVSSFLVPIPDCDETFNYWEPTHLLLYKKGLQTWEYSPIYALRSYFYIWIHAAIGIIIQFLFNILRYTIHYLPNNIVSLLGQVIIYSSQESMKISKNEFIKIIFNESTEKIIVFFGIRASLALFSSLCEVWFLNGVSSRLGRRVSYLTGFFLLVSSGMFLGAQNYLPSSFSMYMLLIAFGSWFYRDQTPAQTSIKWIICVCAAGTSVIVGWPFSVICVLPLAFDTIYQIGIIFALRIAFVISSFLIFCTISIDQIYYEKLMFTPWNLVNYNKGHGSEKYGVEDWTFYFKNLFLNFNGIFLLSLLTPILITIMKYCKSKYDKKSVTIFKYILLGVKGRKIIIYLLPYYIWVAFFSSLYHKEERFMTLIYPMICLSAAIGLEIIIGLLFTSYFDANSSNEQSFSTTNTTNKTNTTNTINTSKGSSNKISNLRTTFIGKFIIFFILLIYSILCFSRIIAMIQYYSAPITAYSFLSQQIERNFTQKNQNVNVCVGKEWYRFPSSFFLPGPETKLRFLRSGFKGQLPKYYPNWPFSTSAIPTNMNDENREEMDRYINENQCHFLVDFQDGGEELDYSKDTKNWRLIYASDFLIGSKTSILDRAFWFPYRSSKRVYGKYHILHRK